MVKRVRAADEPHRFTVQQQVLDYIKPNFNRLVVRQFMRGVSGLGVSLAYSGLFSERFDLVFREASHDLISFLVDIDDSVRPAGACVRRKVYPVRRKDKTDAGKLA